jgi:hypothetical protein
MTPNRTDSGSTAHGGERRPGRSIPAATDRPAARAARRRTPPGYAYPRTTGRQLADKPNAATVGTTTAPLSAAMPIVCLPSCPPVVRGRRRRDGPPSQAVRGCPPAPSPTRGRAPVPVPPSFILRREGGAHAPARPARARARAAAPLWMGPTALPDVSATCPSGPAPNQLPYNFNRDRQLWPTGRGERVWTILLLIPLFHLIAPLLPIAAPAHRCRDASVVARAGRP